MADAVIVSCPELDKAIWRLYRDFFDRAEKRRRWNLRDDIPWNECNPHLNPAIADVVESFCAVELYLPGLYVEDPAGGAFLPRPNLVLRQLGLRGIEASAGPARLVAALRATAARAAGRHRQDGLLRPVEPAPRQPSRHVGLCDGAGIRHLAQLPQPARRVQEQGDDPALARRCSSWPWTRRPITPSSATGGELYLDHDRPAMLEQSATRHEQLRHARHSRDGRQP